MAPAREPARCPSGSSPARQDHVAHPVVAAEMAAAGMRHADPLMAAAKAPDHQDLVIVGRIPGLLLELPQLDAAMRCR